MIKMASPNKRVSGFGLRLRPNPRFARNFRYPLDVRLCEKSKNLIKCRKKWEKEVKY